MNDSAVLEVPKDYVVGVHTTQDRVILLKR